MRAREKRGRVEDAGKGGRWREEGGRRNGGRVEGGDGGRTEKVE